MTKEGSGNKNYVRFMLVTLGLFLVALILYLCGITGANHPEGFLGVVTFILAFMPILSVLIGMLGFNLSAMKVCLKRRYFI